MDLARVLRYFPLRVFFLTVAPVIAFFHKKEPNYEDVKLPKSEMCEAASHRLTSYWTAERQRAAAVGKRPSLLRALCKTFWRAYTLLGALKFMWSAATVFSAYYLLRWIIDYMTPATQDRQEGLLVSGLILVACVLASFFINHMYFEGMRVGVRVRAALMDLVYCKCMVISRFKGGAGDVVNLLATHCSRVGDAALSSHYLWTAVLEIIAIFALAAAEVGIVSLSAIGIFLIFLPIQLKIGNMINGQRQEDQPHHGARAPRQRDPDGHQAHQVLRLGVVLPQQDHGEAHRGAGRHAPHLHPQGRQLHPRLLRARPHRPRLPDALRVHGQHPDAARGLHHHRPVQHPALPAAHAAAGHQEHRGHLRRAAPARELPPRRRD